MNNSNAYNVYSVFVSTFPGGSLLYSKMYGNSCSNDIGGNTNAPDPMSFAALFYAIQTYANELCTDKPMTLKHFYQHGKIVCFKIHETFLVTAVLSMKVGSVNGLKYCEIIGDAFLKKINEEKFNIYSGKKLKGFKKHLKKCNVLLLINLIKMSTLFLNFENIVQDKNNYNNNNNNNNDDDTTNNNNVVSNELHNKKNRNVIKKPADTTDKDTKRYHDCIIIGRLNRSQSLNTALKIQNNTTITNTKEDTSLQPSFVEENGQQIKNSKNSIFSSINFFKRKRNNNESTKKTGATNNTSNFKKNHTHVPSDSYKKHEENDENIILNNVNPGNILKMGELYIYRNDGKDIVESLVKIDNSNDESNCNEDDLNNTITIDEKKIITKYLEKYKKNLDDDDHFHWYSFKCHDTFIGYICCDLIIIKRYDHHRKTNSKMNLKTTLEQNTNDNTPNAQNDNMVALQLHPPFPVDIMLTEENLNILDSIKNGIYSKQVVL